MKDCTRICVVLDASGSMASIEDDTRGSFNTFIRKQREAGGRTVLDLYQFSDRVSRIVEHVDLSEFHGDLMANYRCSGCTALNDAVCTAIDTLGRELSETKEEERPANVVFAIVTDGMENASREFSTEDVRRRITEQKEKYNWDFQFLAANQDAFASGGRMGIGRENCANFVPDGKGVREMCCFLCDRIEHFKASKKEKRT